MSESDIKQKTVQVTKQLIYGYSFPVNDLVDDSKLELTFPENMSVVKQFKEIEKACNEKIISHIEKDKDLDYWKFTFYRYWIRNGMLYIGRNVDGENGISIEDIQQLHFDELNDDELFQNVEKGEPKLYTQMEYVPYF